MDFTPLPARLISSPKPIVHRFFQFIECNNHVGYAWILLVESVVLILAQLDVLLCCLWVDAKSLNEVEVKYFEEGMAGDG